MKGARIAVLCFGLLIASVTGADGGKHHSSSDEAGRTNRSRGEGHSSKGHHHRGAGGAVCSVSAVSLVFGPYDEFQLAHRDSTGYVAVSCYGRHGERAAYTLSLSAGNGSFAYRRMRSPEGATLNYNLYASPARVLAWGDGNSGSVTVSDSYSLRSGAMTRKYPIYGRLFSLQKKPVGIYSDTVIVTLDY